MSGTEIVQALLAANVGVTTLVPPERIAIGGMGQGFTLPSIIITRVSRTGTTPVRGRATRSGERVQVTAYAAGDATRAAVLVAVVAALDGRAGTLAGVAHAAVGSLGGGPDFRDETGFWMGSEDFRVSYPN